ncbi:MAG: DUF2764 family protein [Kiritimatiellia bacterium]|jgi:hypothetical protein
MSYHYFAATLPGLQFGREPTMTAEAFRAQCQEHMSARDCAVVFALLDGGASDHPYARAWRNGETQLRNAVAKLRATKLRGADPAPWLREHRGVDVRIENRVAAAFQEADPLKRERALDQLRWDLAGEIAGYDTLSAEAVFAYAVRLGILLRQAKADPVKGRERLFAHAREQTDSHEPHSLPGNPQT